MVRIASASVGFEWCVRGSVEEAAVVVRERVLSPSASVEEELRGEEEEALWSEQLAAPWATGLEGRTCGGSLL